MGPQLLQFPRELLVEEVLAQRVDLRPSEAERETSLSKAPFLAARWLWQRWPPAWFLLLL